jgi:hypothetical protein
MGSMVSRVAVQLLVSQEGLCSVELVFSFAFLISYGSFAALGVYCAFSSFVALFTNDIPSVSDVNYLSAAAPPAAAEWSNLLRPLRGREPEGMWNLLSIVREMFKRNDRNAIPLLEIITVECMACEQVCDVTEDQNLCTVIPHIICLHPHLNLPCFAVVENFLL